MCINSSPIILNKRYPRALCMSMNLCTCKDTLIDSKIDTSEVITYLHKALIECIHSICNNLLFFFFVPKPQL